MDAGRVLLHARKRAGLTQRDLAARARVHQSAIARIESGRSAPRVDTLDRLLEVCGEGLYARVRVGQGLDRSHIRDFLTWTPAELSRAAEESTPYTGRGGAPRPPWRPEQAVRTLVRHGVRFILIGGYAGNLHGSPSVTFDTDLCYAHEPLNLERLASALQELHAVLAGAPEGLPFILDARTLRNSFNFTFNTDAGGLDCLALPEGVGGFDELERNAVWMEVGGARVLVASVEDIIRMKRAAGRRKDLIEIEVLGALQEEIDRKARARRRRTE